MRFDFIHIGMMKTATTYMQNVWQQDPTYCLSWQGNTQFLNELRNNVIQDNTNMLVSTLINTDTVPKSNQTVVVSREGFSTAFLNQPVYQDKIPEFVDYTSKSLNQVTKKTENLLITIREPISWIRSMYVQSIKQGNYGSAQEFVDKQSEFLKNSLDLEYVISCYKRYFSNILVLPFELLKENKKIFWGVISDAFQVPVAKDNLDQKMNTSLNLERTYLLSKMNEMSRLLTNTLKNSSDYNNVKEKRHLIINHLSNEKWVHRRFVEYASSEQIHELYNLFGITNPPIDFLEFKLTNDLKDAIQKNYIDFLKENTIPEVSEEYQAAFDEITHNI
ncbi:hypothetical protein [Gracilibacillus sp. YIM 98692]|uniref:hypothetical protein n=1 Tax=Gracilibacillus sp. YIM 98692 TaxID=2663532 RepID=UPI0013D809D1|nr:hypothetical protein [Gracilibacillus sp. YIM 98692]